MNAIALSLEALARSSPTAFASVAMLDERTGKPVRLAPHHRRMFGNWNTRRKTVQIAPSEFGKSHCFAAWLAWRVGLDPSLRIGLLSGTREQACRLLRLVAIVMNGRGFQRVFPSVRIDRLTADELTVTGRPDTQKDVNVMAAAFDLSSMLGARLDLAACDDVVSRDSVRTSGARDLAYQSFLSVTASRVAPVGEIHVVNTAEHSDDIPHRLARLPGWHFESYPALDTNGAPTWPERWPMTRIEERRGELGAVGFERALMCKPIDAASLVFSLDDIAAALRRGADGYHSPAGGRVILGVDCAWSTNPGADESAIVMCVIDSSGFRHVTRVEGVRLRYDKLAERVVEIARANRATVYVDAAGVGKLIAEAIARRVPCKPMTANGPIKQARVEALAAEMASGRWVLSCPYGGVPDAEMRKLCDELATFSFETHTGDRASALLLACEGARALEQRPKGRAFRIDLITR